MAVQDLETTIQVDSNSEPSGSVSGRRGCFCFPCFRDRRPPSTAVGSVWWERVSTVRLSDRRWWSRGVTALRKVREWSEIVAGPKWKTFIRRLNRNSRTASGSGKFQYDPLSYSLNFDEGQGYNGNLDAAEEEEEQAVFRDFSSRYGQQSSAHHHHQAMPVIVEKHGGDVAVLAS